MTTKKKSYAARLGVLALALTLATTCLMGGTLAKYTSEVTGTGTVAVAKWSFKADNTGTPSATETWAFTLADTKAANANVKTDRVAPGDTGSVVIKMDASGSEVAVDYSITIDKTGLSTTNGVIEFYSDKSCTTEIPVGGLTGSIALDDVGTAVEKPIYWKWVTTDNTADTALGTTAVQNETFTVTVKAEQKTAQP